MKIKNNLTKWKFKVHDHPRTIEIIGIFIFAPPFHAELHDVADILGKRNDLHADIRLFNMFYFSSIRHFGRIIYLDYIRIGKHNPVLYVWNRRNDVYPVLPLQALLNDLHMEQAEKTAAETETKRDGGLRSINKRSVVKRELFERLPQILELI